MDDSTLPSFTRSLIPSWLRSHLPSFLRQVAGMPDYATHLDHLRRCHPERPFPTEQQFFMEFVRAKYADGPTRCC